MLLVFQQLTEQSQLEICKFKLDRLSDTNLLTALKAVETAEQGQFFIGADGNCIFRDRNFKRTQQFTSNATFGNGVGELPFSDVITNFDESRIVNIVAVTRSGGTEQLVENN